MMPKRELQVWALTTGEAGMRAQARALAAALTRAPAERTIRLRPPWSLARRPLPGLLRFGLDPRGDRLEPPWPDVVVSCGRRAALAALAIGEASGGASALVHVQDPRCDASRFDLVVAMSHDDIAGENVLTVTTTLSEVTPQRLAEAAAVWSERLGALPRPIIGVLLGGPTARGGLRERQGAALAGALAKLRAASGASLAITPSRRTPPAIHRRFAAAFAGLPDVFLWDGAGDNPYLGILSLADRLVVTGDSVSMISEAIATGRPVDVFDTGGRPRHARFLAMLEREGLARRFAGALEAPPAHAPLNPTALAAAAVLRRLQARTGVNGKES